jgi:hypothetical protein
VSKVIADITMSSDGYVAPPSGDVDELQARVMAQDPVDTEILERATAATGAVVIAPRPDPFGGGIPLLFRAGTRQMYRQGGIRPSGDAVHLTYERLVGRLDLGRSGHSLEVLMVHRDPGEGLSPKEEWDDGAQQRGEGTAAFNAETVA